MIVGIDLGTTHSLVGAYRDDGPVLFPNALGVLLTPSVVSLDGDRILVGQAARELSLIHISPMCTPACPASPTISPRTTVTRCRSRAR